MDSAPPPSGSSGPKDAFAIRPVPFADIVGEAGSTLEARLDGLRAVLPEEKDVGDLLRRIQTLAVQSNLQIKGFKPAPIVTKQMHAEWPISLELDGTYHNLGQFFDRVGKFSRIINIGGVKIKAKDKPQPGSTIAVTCGSIQAKQCGWLLPLHGLLSR